MRIAVIGAGGVGGYFGGRLAKAGHDVSFVARGRHPAAMREKGIAIDSARGHGTVPATSATHAAPVSATLYAAVKPYLGGKVS